MSPREDGGRSPLAAAGASRLREGTTKRAILPGSEAEDYDDSDATPNSKPDSDPTTADTKRASEPVPGAAATPRAAIVEPVTDNKDRLGLSRTSSQRRHRRRNGRGRSGSHPPSSTSSSSSASSSSTSSSSSFRAAGEAPSGSSYSDDGHSTLGSGRAGGRHRGRRARRGSRPGQRRSSGSVNGELVDAIAAAAGSNQSSSENVLGSSSAKVNGIGGIGDYDNANLGLGETFDGGTGVGKTPGGALAVDLNGGGFAPPAPRALNRDFVLRQELDQQRRRFAEQTFIAVIVTLAFVVLENELQYQYRGRSWTRGAVTSLKCVISLLSALTVLLILRTYIAESHIAKMRHLVPHSARFVDTPGFTMCLAECLLCSLHVPPFVDFVMRFTSTVNGEDVQTVIQGDALNCFLFVRLYVMIRVVRYRSRWNTAGAAFIGSLNKVVFDTGFIIKTFAHLTPFRMLFMGTVAFLCLFFFFFFFFF
jgi:hypothetical protein